MRKMKITSLFAAALLVAAGVSSCSDDNGLQHTPAAVGDAINFGVGAFDTRTSYGTGEGEDQWQLYWNHSTDIVRLFCNEAQQGSGTDYVVVEDPKHTGEDKNKWGALKARTDGQQMKWGEGKETDGTHTFYAAYPGNNDQHISVEKYADNYAIFKCPINRSQKVELGEKNSEGNYSTTADMREAFMVASATGNRKTTEQITFHFKPIMTTLEVTISRSSSDNTNTSCTISGLNVIASVPEEAANSDYFYYKVPSASGVDAGLCDANGTLEDNTTNPGTATTTTFVDIVNPNATGEELANCVELEPGESVTLTVFLPPMVNMKGVKLRVACAGSNASQSVTATVNSDIPASSKKKIKLPAIEGASTGNNWITGLNGKIYVQQLSIPGTHDAGTYKTSLDGGRTQELSIEDQFKMGIRAFDLRPAYRSWYKEFWLYHGSLCTSYTLKKVLDYFKEQLIANPGEFVLIQMRHETEVSTAIKDTDKWDEIYNLLKNYDDYIVQWKPDLTIDECRGKMIIFTRTDFKNRKKVALVEPSFKDNTYGEVQLTADGKTAVYHVQDYYNAKDENQKLAYLKGLYAITCNFNQDTNNFPWALNHTSGYSGGNVTSTGYMSNATKVNRPFYEYITTTSQVGPTGIVFMDYVGARKVTWSLSSYKVYGDLLPQAIIDQNYRCRLLRKQ